MNPIVGAGDSVLAKRAAEVPLEKIESSDIKNIIARMKVALAGEALGVAIAAPQIGESLRIFVVGGKVFSQIKKTKDEPDRAYINPEILKLSRRRKDMHEGCLSVRSEKPDTLVWGTVPRSEKIKIRAYDESGKLAEHSASGFLAQIFQHEIDHLEGILYTSKATDVYEEKISKPE
ncbi:MAG: peptide deformylase [Parcubacteria group bacterium]|nr:peptide deformylase [Parcubacteria group bacterium]